MKVLIIFRGTDDSRRPYITEQANALAQKAVKIKYMSIEGKGINAYISSFLKLKKQIKSFRPDLIHAHYGISGLFANMQRKGSGNGKNMWSRGWGFAASPTSPG